MVIKKIGENKKEEALELVLRGFMKYEAPDYSDEGVETFKRTVVYNEDYIESIIMYGAYINAQEVYHHLGFEDTASEQVTDGIRYIPMSYKRRIK